MLGTHRWARLRAGQGSDEARALEDGSPQACANQAGGRSGIRRIPGSLVENVKSSSVELGAT
jgi:hypothetical protein